ncbi:TPA: bifunctional glucose-1-phosphatase/inositol phosphatase [Providencia stuartii]|uniref:Histidine acid phosphatase n=2 Tax=Providencia stuartii TaxID=588 RepID=A0AA86YHR7_PROST|nr:MULTISPECIES: bifunctional glucose-1-phosphatase/inositol phosphatase [Providencia]SST02580.1 Glucose-1-phosphatase precursor [Acinetobacter baumannii]AFH95348.1 glucose-1-phosphatase/inositol phosphatase [Providencia stuartii MRSN 2154]AIN62960.1 histidine phosphatase super family protein [Providencia stuartii]AXO20521.1 bifunctional glucose-1-phosphatase/inositol phosphatase [Providencia stuartii]EDU58678.1 histidine acid phosphatase [Providencia stuartii ATCC 25827]
MKYKVLTVCLSAALLTPMTPVLANTDNVENMQLDQVLLLSRHNLRTPIVNTGILTEVTDKKWPAWDAQSGYLTTKGGALEVYMGHYFREWIEQNKLVPDELCPTGNEDLFVYTNSLQRTIATAQFFTAGAFPGCTVKIHHQPEIGKMDPVFNPIITNDSPEFKQKALLAMEEHLKGLNLKPGYDELDTVLDIKNSEKCKTDKLCELSSQTNSFIIEANKEPGVVGSLKIANSAVDAIDLQYYEGFPESQVAWGMVNTDDKWTKLNTLKNGYQETLFSPKLIAKNVAHPLLNYINKGFVSADKGETAKFIMLVGHDSNIASLMSAMDFKPYKLPDQYEYTPIGGKLVFQRWHDKSDKKDYVKVEYVYQTAEQLRNNSYLSLETPPKHVTLEMKNCPIDKNGYCSWEDFQKVMKSALDQSN